MKEKCENNVMKMGKGNANRLQFECVYSKIKKIAGRQAEVKPESERRKGNRRKLCPTAENCR